MLLPWLVLPVRSDRNCVFGKLSEDVNCGCRCRATHNLILNWFVALEILLLLMLLLPRTLPSPRYDQTDNLSVVFVACNWQLTVHLAAGTYVAVQKLMVKCFLAFDTLLLLR